MISIELRERFEKLGATVETSAHLRKIEADELLLTVGGTAEVYLCRIDDDGHLGRRTFLYEAGPHGSLIFGEQTEDGFCLLAVPGHLTEFVILRGDAIENLFSQSVELLVEPIAGWLERTTAPIILSPLPILAHQVTNETNVTVRGTSRYYSRKPFWTEVVSGRAKLLEKGPYQTSESLMLPVVTSCWIVADDGTELRLLDFAGGLAHPTALASLRAYHQAVLKLLVSHQEQQTEIDSERIQTRAEVDHDTDKRAWTHLSQVLTGEKREVIHQRTESEPLLAACRLVGQSMDISIEPSLRASANDPIDDIARASNLRLRRVKLEKGWWKLDAGSLVGHLKEDGRPVALLATGAGSYELRDPKDGSKVRVDATVAEKLEPIAAMFYRRLPDRPIGVKDVFALALLGSGRDLVALMVLGAATGVLALAGPIATKFLFNEILPSGQLVYLDQLMWGLLLVALCNMAFMFSYSTALVRFGGRFSSDMATSVFDRLMTLPMPFYRRYAIGDLAQRGLGISRMRELVTGGTMTKIISSVFALTSFVLLVIYDWKLSLMAGFLLLLNLVFSTRAGLLQLKYRRKAAFRSGQVNAILYQILGGLPKLRVAGAESRFFAYWAQRFAQQMDNEYKAGSIGVAVSVFNTAFPLVSNFLVFAYVGLTHQHIATGTLLGFMAAYIQCSVAIANLSDSAAEVSEALPQLERTTPILEAIPEKDEQKIDPGELSGTIELSNVSFRYNEEQGKVLNQVNLRVHPREFVALVGGTGAGKSTVLNMLLGFDQPDSGSVFYDKKDLHMLDVQAVRQQIGVVLQDGRIAKDTVYRNVAGGRPLESEQVWEALRMVGLDLDIEAMPMGLDTVISSETFSGGQSQRLIIARAIVSRPRIIFFDEATSALDNQTQAIVSRSLEQLNAARVVIAHRLSTIRNADRIYVFDKGHVVQSGTFDELGAQDGIFAELMARQQAP